MWGRLPGWLQTPVHFSQTKMAFLAQQVKIFCGLSEKELADRWLTQRPEVTTAPESLTGNQTCDWGVKWHLFAMHIFAGFTCEILWAVPNRNQAHPWVLWLYPNLLHEILHSTIPATEGFTSDHHLEKGKKTPQRPLVIFDKMQSKEHTQPIVLCVTTEFYQIWKAFIPSP